MRKRISTLLTVNEIAENLCIYLFICPFKTQIPKLHKNMNFSFILNGSIDCMKQRLWCNAVSCCNKSSKNRVNNRIKKQWPWGRHLETWSIPHELEAYFSPPSLEPATFSFHPGGLKCQMCSGVRTTARCCFTGKQTED